MQWKQRDWKGASANGLQHSVVRARGWGQEGDREVVRGSQGKGDPGLVLGEKSEVCEPPCPSIAQGRRQDLQGMVLCWLLPAAMEIGVCRLPALSPGNVGSSLMLQWDNMDLG